MPKRPASHVIGDRATNAVSDLIGRAEHAVERILNDYGEDLLVQTAHAGRMDACRLWVQVKGTAASDRLRLADGNYRVRVRFDQALRWLRTLDTVIVVLWDVSAGRGWLADPKDQVDEFRPFGQKTVTLRFDDEQRFDIDAVDVLAWQARLDHYGTLFADARQHHEISKDIGYDEPPLALTALGLDLLGAIGLVKTRPPLEFCLEDVARRAFWDSLGEFIGDATAAALPRKIELLDDFTQEALVAAAAVTFLESLDYPHLRVPVHVLDHCANLLVTLAGFRRTPAREVSG